MLDEFVAKYNLKKVCNGGLCQCVALARQYLDDVLHLPQFPTVQGAYQIFDVAQNEYYNKVLNSPTAVPPRGAIIIWKASYGGVGHVGIVLEADVNGILVFSQNHTGNGDPCVVTSYSYNLVRGWLIKKEVSMAGKLYNNSAGQVWLSFDNKKFYVEDANSIAGETIINGDAPGEIMIKQSDQDARLAEQQAVFNKKLEAINKDLTMCRDTVDSMTSENKEAVKKLTIDLDMCNVLLERCKAGSHGPVVPSGGFVAWLKRLFNIK